MKAVDTDWEVTLRFADMMADPAEAFAQVFPLNPCRQGLMRSYDAQTGKKESETVKQHVTLDDVRRNLALSGHAGRLGFLPGGQERTSVGMVDIDRKQYNSREDMRRVVNAVRDVMNRARMFCYEEESTNGGVHLWVFLSEPVPYQVMVDALKVLTAEAGHRGLETYPVGGKGAEGKWVFMPYAGAQNDEQRLGLTFLRDRKARHEPIPVWALPQAIQRVAVADLLAVLSRKPQEPQQTPKQATAQDLAPDGYALLVAATLTPPAGFERHASIEAFLNLAERMGKQDDMAAHLKSEAMYATWIADESRTREAWAAEIDRWQEGDSERQYGITFLTDQGWKVPDLPKLKPQTGSKSKNEKLDGFKALEQKYAPPVPSKAATPHKGKSRLRSYGFDNLDDIPVSEPLVENILVKRSLCALVGKSGAGKSMIALDVAFHVGLGMPWRDRKVERGAVAWVAAEGREETADRMEAWRTLHNKEREELSNFRMLDAPSEPLTDVQPSGGLEQMILGIKDIEEETGPLALIVIDTVSRTYGVGMEENDNNDMVFYTNCAELLTRIFGATVWLLHHQGRGNSTAARGASAFDAPMEVITAIEKKVGYFDLTTIKMRSGTGEADPVPIRLVTRQIKRGSRERGVGVVDHSAIATHVVAGPDMLSTQQRAVYDALEDLCLPDTREEERKHVKRAEWIALCRERKIPDATVKETIRKLVKDKLVLDTGRKGASSKGPYVVAWPAEADL